MSDCVNTRPVSVLDYIQFCEARIKSFSDKLAEWEVQYLEAVKEYDSYNRWKRFWKDDPRHGYWDSSWCWFHDDKWQYKRSLKHWENEYKQAMYLRYTLNERTIKIAVNSSFWDSVIPEAF